MRRRRGGFSVLEVVVALLLLQVCLTGVLGLFVLASERLSRALAVERAAAEVAAVADSLSASGAGGGGEALRGPWRITWGEGGSGIVVRASLAEDPGSTPVVEVSLP